MSLFLGASPEQRVFLRLDRANRHGLVAGATGTGKTVTLQIMAQGFSDAGVPVICADVKGDLSGIATPGSDGHKLHEKLLSRAEKIGLDGYAYASAPTIFWDLYGDKGHPVRTTLTEMGPLLLSRLMNLTDAQEGVIAVAFAYADDEGLALVDLADLRTLLLTVAEKRKELALRYGSVAPQSVAAIQRKLLQLEQQGADLFFGEPALTLPDLMRTDQNGAGVVNVIDATKLINSPKLYATFLLWLLSELFEELPEVGDPEKPVLAFFFDEAHLLFDDAPDALLDKIEQVVRLIRSKGVGVYFVTQNPRDLPESVLAQLGNRIQHALRAYTPSERKAVRAASDSFRPNPAFDTETVITELGVGEALVSVLDEKGAPGVVQQTLIRPPSSRLGPLSDVERAAIMADSPVKGVYDEAVDRETAHEILTARAKTRAKEIEAQELAAQREKERLAREAAQAKRSRSSSRRRSSRASSEFSKTTRSAVNTLVREATRQLLRGLLGSVKR